jgi:DNA-directed RNA polymerase III subunit RPC8
MEFFDDILIPADYLQEGSVFDTEEQVWVWQWEGNSLYMDLEETIIFRVIEEHFTAVTPVKQERQRRSSISGEPAGNVPLTSAKTPPYTLTVALCVNR